jgi:hypothetical protein
VLPGTAVVHGAKRASAALTVITLTGMFAAGQASAAPAWLPAASLGGSDISAESPSIAVAANGDAAGVMYVEPPTGQDGVQALTHRIGGTWQQTMLGTAAGASDESVTIDAAGDANAMWWDGDTIDVATAPGDGAWSTPVQVDPGVSNVIDTPSMAEDAAGDVIVAFDTDQSGQLSPYQIWWTERPAGGSWSTPRELVGASGDPESQVSGDANGDFVVWWEDYLSPNEVLAADVRPAGGGWEATARYVSPMGPAPSINNPDVVLGPGGTAHAIWSSATSPPVLDSSDFSPGGTDGGTWSPSAQVTIAGSGATFPLIGFDTAGDETLVWSPVSGGMSGIDAASRPAGGSWSGPTTLLPMGDGGFTTPSLSVSPSGQAVAGFADQTGTPPTTELSLRPAGGSWQPAIELSPYDSGSQNAPSLGQDNAGDVLAAWQENIGQIQSWDEVYDANGPVMTNPSIPTNGTVGVPVTFAVTPLGTWSPVTSTQWSFGDDTAAIDQTVSHTYSQPGKYTVSASAGDAQGNSSTSSGTITISTAPPPAPASPGSGSGSGSVKPALSRISQSHARWRDGRAAAKAARARRPKKPPVGTRFAFALNENAQVQLSFTQLLAGRRVKRRCVAPVAANRRAHACQRTKLRGTLTYTVSAGAHHVSFDGRIGRTRLGVGKYTVALSASDAAGRSRVNSLQFTIVR